MHLAFPYAPIRVCFTDSAAGAQAAHVARLRGAEQPWTLRLVQRPLTGANQRHVRVDTTDAHMVAGGGYGGGRGGGQGVRN